MTVDEQINFCHREMRYDCFLSSVVENIIDIDKDMDVNEKASNKDWKLRAESEIFSVSCLMINTIKNCPKTEICTICNKFPCTCNTTQQRDLLDNTANISTSNNEDIEIFPPFLSDISNRPDIKPMQVLWNLEVVRDLEFHHEYISEQIEKFFSHSYIVQPL